jgi:cysteine protease ATG4
MTVPKHSQTSPSSAGDMALISPVSSTSSNPSTSTQSHGSGTGTAAGKLPAPPPADRLPPPKARSAGPGQSQRFTLRRKDKDKEKDKDKRKPIPAEDGEEDWTIEGTTGTGTGTGTDRRHGHDVLISPPSKEDLRTAPIRLEEPVDLFDSQLTEVPSKEMEKKKSRGRGLVKKTSKLFLRGGGDRDKDISASLAPRPSERQQSYSSATSNDSAITSASSSNASIQIASVSRAPPPSGHSRRLSHDSQFSWQGAQSIRSAPSANQPTGLETRRMSNSNNLSASVPALSRISLPQPGQSSRGPETIPSRMSSWFTNLLPSTSSATIFESPATQDQQPTTSSPARKGPSAAASFLYAARQKAVDGVRNLLDSEAQPDKSPDIIWVMGVGHPGYRPSSPFDSPNSSAADLPTVVEGQVGKRRGSSSSGTSMNVASPSFKTDQAALRPAVWPKRRDPAQVTSPPPKGIGNLFSASSLSLALPSSSPQKDSNQLDSPGKGKRKDREVIKWPEQCKLHPSFSESS